MDVDVLVVGAGPTGLTLAGELARHGVSFRCIDAARGPTDLSKAIGVQARTLETLDIMGAAGGSGRGSLADALVARGNQAKAFRIYDGTEQIMRLDFSRMDTRFPYLLMVPQSDTEEVLLGNLRDSGHEVERGTTLTSLHQDDTGVTVSLARDDGKRRDPVRARWVVGCDGAHSTVRKMIGLGFSSQDYQEGFLLADVRVHADLPTDELYLFLHDGRLMALFCLPQGRCRLIADLPLEQASPQRRPTLEECQRLLAERSPFPIRLSDPRWTACYRIHRRIVSHLRKRQVFLAGDAAHIHSPAAAQGMNTGIQDAFNLGWKLALVAIGRAHEQLLDTYHIERYPVEQSVLRNTDLLLKLASLRQPLVRGARKFLLSHFSSSAAFQRRLSASIGELLIDYHRSPITVERGYSRGPRAGARAPDGTLLREGGIEVRIYELLREGRFVTLVFPDYGPDQGACNADRIDAYLIRQAAHLLAAHAQRMCGYLVTRHDLSAQAGLTVLRDAHGEVYGRYALGHPGVRVLRPDGYIGLRTDTYRLEAGLVGFTGRVFG